MREIQERGQGAYTKDGFDEEVGTEGKKLNRRQVRQGTEDSFVGAKRRGGEAGVRSAELLPYGSCGVARACRLFGLSAENR